jgi:hypothetical protein
MSGLQPGNFFAGFLLLNAVVVKFDRRSANS